MREYETVYLLKPDLPQDQISSVKDKYTKAISKAKGHLLSQGDWGKRKMAYNVKKIQHGHYIYLRYLGEEGLVSNLERLLRIEDNVLKFLTVKVAEDIDVKTRTKEAKKQEAPPPPEEVMRSAPVERGYDRRGSGRGPRSRDFRGPERAEPPREKKTDAPPKEPKSEERKED